MLPAAANLVGSLALQCAMCYQTAAAQGPRGIRAMNLGILLLIVPVVSIISCITVVTYRHRGSAPPSD
ncbi:MAG: hypothetical protein HY238_13900 [Acidobacteria bacterium]|nr:hypothetical protein [Acidobacteriota bacterium]